jgi:NAD+ synthase (glutamine-hydrolysing)
MRVALAQINSVLGDFEGNANQIIRQLKHAKKRRAELVVFPECALFGYSPNDLLERAELVGQQLKYIQKIQKQIPSGVATIFGAITINPNKRGKLFYNSAVIVTKENKPIYFHKTLLPIGDVFDEGRFFEPGDVTKNVFKLGSKKILVTICEDIWAWDYGKQRNLRSQNPLLNVKEKVDLVVNLSASPYCFDKLKIRESMVRQTSRRFKAPMVYVNMVGGQDELIFDGNSFAVSKTGKIITRGVGFEPSFNLLDLQNNSADIPLREDSEIQMLRQALVLGLRDFLAKNSIKKLHLGLSGGIDSAVVACLAVDAVGPANVTGIAMPSQFNDPVSLELARALANNIGIEFKVFEIETIFNIFSEKLEGFGLTKFGLPHENLQARLRGTTLMAWSNIANSLLLSTGNKSELASGYSTLYGDLCGGIAPIGDLLKRQVYALAKLYNEERELIPEQIITRAPSAELRPNQKDQDTLPEYTELDKAVEKLVTQAKPAKSKVEKWLLQAMYKSEFKRWQAPPILKISSHSFGRGRRMPVAKKLTE